jgi:hypothetical protein
MTAQQTAVRNTGVLSLLQGIIVERQRLLIREANYLRTNVGLPPVRGEDGVMAMTSPTPGNLPAAPPDPAPGPTRLALNYNRRAILRPVTVALERGEEPTYNVIRVISGVPERTPSRALRWAPDPRVLVNRGGAYVPVPGWPGATPDHTWPRRDPRADDSAGNRRDAEEPDGVYGAEDARRTVAARGLKDRDRACAQCDQRSVPSAEIGNRSERTAQRGEHHCSDDRKQRAKGDERGECPPVDHPSVPGLVLDHYEPCG